MENLDNVKFKMTIPYNNKSLLKYRKRTKILCAITLFVVALFWGFFLIMSLIMNKKSVIAIVMFSTFAIICLGVTIFSLITIKARDKDNDKTIQYIFYENHLEIIQQGGKKNKYLKTCLYRKYKDKQFVKKLVEREDWLEIVILIGYTYIVPQYQKFAIPLPKETNEKVDNFKSFLKEKVTKYIVKK